MSDFVVVTHAEMYGGNWLVIRRRDLRLVHEGGAYECCRWVDVWGSTLGLGKRGIEVSPRLLTEVAWAL